MRTQGATGITGHPGLSGVRGWHGVMNQYMSINFKTEAGYTVKEKVYQGKNYLIVPVTMMVEGVHHGSRGSLYHPIDELGHIPESWNGIPIVVGHPEENGVPISANSPEVLEDNTIGIVFHTKVKGSKLQAEAWFQEDVLTDKQPEILKAIRASKNMEVSVGVFTDEEDVEGEWEGETYTAIAHNHRPDHLAILPNEKGACSIADGCGLGVNEGKTPVRKRTILAANSDGSFNQITEALGLAIRGEDQPDCYSWIEEVFDDHIIYRTNTNSNDPSKLYKQSYKYEEGKVELMGDIVEVRKKVEYVLNKSVRTKSLKTEVEMNVNACPKCVEKINALIANTASGFVEADREWLNGLTEVALDKIAPRVIEKEVTKTIEVNRLTPAQEADLAFVARQRTDKRNAMISGIQANAGKDLWPDAKFAALSDDLLETVYASTRKEKDVDYSLNGNVEKFQVNTGAEEALLPQD